MASKNHSVASTVLYSGVSPASGKTFGSMPWSSTRGECEQDVAGNVEPAGRESQAGERDHGVAAPVGEPGISGNHRVKVSRARTMNCAAAAIQRRGKRVCRDGARDAPISFALRAPHSLAL